MDKDTHPPGVEISLEQSARLLNVSPAHAVKLASAGHLGEVKVVAGSMILRLEAVKEYRAALKKHQAAGLEKMMEASERLGLYQDEIAGLPRHRS